MVNGNEIFEGNKMENCMLLSILGSTLSKTANQ